MSFQKQKLVFILILLILTVGGILIHKLLQSREPDKKTTEMKSDCGITCNIKLNGCHFASKNNHIFPFAEKVDGDQIGSSNINLQSGLGILRPNNMMILDENNLPRKNDLPRENEMPHKNDLPQENEKLKPIDINDAFAEELAHAIDFKEKVDCDNEKFDLTLKKSTLNKKSPTFENDLNEAIHISNNEEDVSILKNQGLVSAKDVFTPCYNEISSTELTNRNLNCSESADQYEKSELSDGINKNKQNKIASFDNTQTNETRSSDNKETIKDVISHNVEITQSNNDFSPIQEVKGDDLNGKSVNGGPFNKEKKYMGEHNEMKSTNIEPGTHLDESYNKDNSINQKECGTKGVLELDGIVMNEKMDLSDENDFKSVKNSQYKNYSLNSRISSNSSPNAYSKSVNNINEPCSGELKDEDLINDNKSELTNLDSLFSEEETIFSDDERNSVFSTDSEIKDGGTSRHSLYNQKPSRKIRRRKKIALDKAYLRKLKEGLATMTSACRKIQRMPCFDIINSGDPLLSRFNRKIKKSISTLLSTFENLQNSDFIKESDILDFSILINVLTELKTCAKSVETAIKNKDVALMNKKIKEADILYEQNMAKIAEFLKAAAEKINILKELEIPVKCNKCGKNITGTAIYCVFCNIYQHINCSANNEIFRPATIYHTHLI